jgi:ATP-dependent phosphofructokinase / diphosphate-dependent phosphofructokinase
MGSIKRIGISTGGGDCPGLNAVIRAVVKAAINKHGWEVVGIEDGFDGLIDISKSRPLKLKDVSGILPRGGTILGTTNRGNPFSYKRQVGHQEVVEDISDQVIANAKKLGLDAVIVIGGDGSQKIGLELQQKGLNVVGVPKTIDNDLSSTDTTFGFDTALHTATDAIDKIHTTAESHHRIMVVEVMGRDAGWIALEAGIAGAAHVILIPEIHFSVEKIVEFVLKREAGGKRFSIVVVAEGCKPADKVRNIYERERREVPRGSSAGSLIGEAIGMVAKREVRVTVLGHIQRGGSPSPFDRILSTRLGVAAVDLIAEKKFGRMVCLRGGEISSVEIEDAVGKLKMVDPDGDFVRMARAIGVCFGD